MERRAGRGLHYFLRHLDSGVDPVPRFERLSLLGVSQDGTVNLLHSLLSVTVGFYSMAQWIFACLVELTEAGFPLLAELPAEASAVWCSVCAIPRAYHVSHLEGVTPPVWQSMPCKKEAKLSTRGRDFSCRGLNFVPPYGAYLLLESDLNIKEVSQNLSPALTGLAPTFKEVLYLLKFA